MRPSAESQLCIGVYHGSAPCKYDVVLPRQQGQACEAIGQPFDLLHVVFCPALLCSFALFCSWIAGVLCPQLMYGSDVCSAERYGEELGVSAEENDDLKGTKTTVN